MPTYKSFVRNNPHFQNPCSWCRYSFLPQGLRRPLLELSERAFTFYRASCDEHLGSSPAFLYQFFWVALYCIFSAGDSKCHRSTRGWTSISSMLAGLHKLFSYCWGDSWDEALCLPGQYLNILRLDFDKERGELFKP